jgi:hypothetical protein
MAKRMELLPFKRENLNLTTIQLPGLVVYDADATRVTGKHRFYVFDQANWDQFVPSDADGLKLVVQVTHVCMSKEQILDPAAVSPANPTESWNRVIIAKIQP